jgi:hypothetical protein
LLLPPKFIGKRNPEVDRFSCKSCRVFDTSAIGARSAILPHFVTSRRYIIYFVKIFLRKKSRGTLDALTRAGAVYLNIYLL